MMSSTRAAFDAGLCAWLVPWVLPRDADALACAAVGGCTPAEWAAAKRAASAGPWARWLGARLSELDEPRAVASDAVPLVGGWYLSEMLAADGLWRQRQDAAHFDCPGNEPPPTRAPLRRSLSRAGAARWRDRAHRTALHHFAGAATRIRLCSTRAPAPPVDDAKCGEALHVAAACGHAAVARALVAAGADRAARTRRSAARRSIAAANGNAASRVRGAGPGSLTPRTTGATRRATWPSDTGTRACCCISRPRRVHRSGGSWSF